MPAPRRAGSAWEMMQGTPQLRGVKRPGREAPASPEAPPKPFPMEFLRGEVAKYHQVRPLRLGGGCEGMATPRCGLTAMRSRHQPPKP